MISNLLFWTYTSKWYNNVDVSLKKMTLRKITMDNGVKYIPQSKRDYKPNTIKNNSPAKKQNKNLSRNFKNLFKNIAAEGFRFLKWIMNCYFCLESQQIRWLNRKKQNHKKCLI